MFLKIFNTLQSYSKRPSVITIGTFDGVHIGHQKIITRLVKISEEEKLESVILTFFPHPKMVLQPKSDIKLLHTINERQDKLSQLGLGNLIIKAFTKTFADLSAQDFVENILIKQLNVKHIIIGYDHRFGKNRSADIHDLKAFGKLFNFEVEEISAQDINDVSVSSTKIRNALTQGKILEANSFLGYNYSITGMVTKGKGIGRQIGFPTANIHVKEDYKLIPKNGVYVVKIVIDSHIAFGMLNIGTNPTVNGKKTSIEVHIFDFNTDIYDKTIKVELLQRLRNEHKFESVELLQQQLKKDEINARYFIKNNP